MAPGRVDCRELLRERRQPQPERAMLIQCGDVRDEVRHRRLQHIQPHHDVVLPGERPIIGARRCPVARECTALANGYVARHRPRRPVGRRKGLHRVDVGLRRRDRHGRRDVHQHLDIDIWIDRQAGGGGAVQRDGPHADKRPEIGLILTGVGNISGEHRTALRDGRGDVPKGDVYLGAGLGLEALGSRCLRGRHRIRDAGQVLVRGNRRSQQRRRICGAVQLGPGQGGIAEIDGEPRQHDQRHCDQRCQQRDVAMARPP